MEDEEMNLAELLKVTAEENQTRKKESDSNRYYGHRWIEHYFRFAKIKLIYNVNVPSDEVKIRLSVYGILEIGEVPILAFVTKLTPKELINNPIKNTIYLFEPSFIFIIHSPFHLGCHVF